ncbi:hypothetical protein AAG747_17030 [Rapidithrix thailandica]|uniref:Lipoprotein n=1 Tax=Rapidithrix thailandica TaxID=413964 RepID=A0AAW9S9D7_9BACT
MKLQYFYPILFLFVTACGLKQENEQLKTEVAELKQQMEETEKVNETLGKQMDEVAVLLDSIEASEAMIDISLEKGTTFADYDTRLHAISRYMEETRLKIQELENTLDKSKGQNKMYARLVSTLKSELAEKELKIKTLNEQITTYKKENEALMKTVDLQNEELEARDQELMLKKQELEELDVKVKGMLAEAKKAEADALYAQAQTQEEVAKRTKFAPKKKKREYKAAYDLYQKAFEAGRTDAYEKMEELKDKY